MANWENSNRIISAMCASVLIALSIGDLSYAQMERPVDKKIFCGQGLEAEQQAKAFLKTRAEKPESIDGLNPEFACNLMNFIKAAPGNITIIVGTYVVTESVATRGVAYCRRFQCKEGTNSHPRGFAADLKYNGDDTKPSGPGSPIQCQRNPLCVWAHANAATYGLQYRLMPGHPCFPGREEAWHIELKGTGCDGDTGGFAGNAGPPLGLGDAFRGFLGDKDQTSSFAQPALPGQTLPTTQSVISTFQPGASYAPADVSETTAAPVSLQITGGTNTGTVTSAADRLAALAFGEQKPKPATATSVPLVVSGANAAGLAANLNPVTQHPIQSSGISAASQQTFVSGDLSWQSDTYSQGPVTGWQAILITLKATLVRIFAYLEPFGGREIPEAAS